MAVGYNKEFLVDAFLHRFKLFGLDVASLQNMANSFYDEVGKDKFRVYTSLDAAAVKEYKEFIKNGVSYPNRI